jgi:uncharacterized protein YbjT (DUF2867 family)
MTAAILVTGATGTVGRNVVKDLVRRGFDVRAGVHTPDKYEYIRMTGVEEERLDFTDNATIDRALQGITTLFLITPIAREQVEFARRMIDRARIWGVEHVVKLSMIGAPDLPGTTFTRWHLEAEKYIENSGLAFTFLRCSPFMQNFLRYVQPTGGFIYLPLDSARVSLIDVRDIAEAATEVLIAPDEHTGKAYDLTGPESLTMDDVADALTDAIGSHIGYINISEETARHAFGNLDTPQWMAEGMLEFYGLQRQGRFTAVSTVIDDLLGRKGIRLGQFVHDFSPVLKAIAQHEHHTRLR